MATPKSNKCGEKKLRKKVLLKKGTYCENNIHNYKKLSEYNLWDCIKYIMAMRKRRKEFAILFANLVEKKKAEGKAERDEISRAFLMGER